MLSGMKGVAPVLVFATMILVSCDKSSIQTPSQKELVGKWTLKELETGKGHREPADGIMAGEMQLHPDGSCSSRLQWSKEAIGKEQPVMSASGSWSLSNSVLRCSMGTNAPTDSRVWFDGKLLAIATPQRSQVDLIFYYSKSE